MEETNNRALGEFELISWIREQVTDGDELLCGIGDDCAVDRMDAGQLLLTSTDLLIEDIHFRRAWTSMFDLGRKSVAVNLSDIAAMGGVPRRLYLGIGRSSQLSAKDLKDFIRGFIQEARHYNVILAGGDTCSSPGPLIISVTVQGQVPPGLAVMRHGARCDDAIYVSGTLGDSALALRLLEQGQVPPVSVAERFHTPTPRVELGCYLSNKRLATAMLDVSDGLLADLSHLLTASGVGAELNMAALPLSPTFRNLLGAEPELIDLALAGGEDYELLFSSPRHDLDDQFGGAAVSKIGVITAQPGIILRHPEGGIYQCQRRGFEHFAEQ